MLQLPSHLHEAIKQHGVKAYPYEGCGLLLGRAEEGVNIVSRSWKLLGDRFGFVEEVVEEINRIE